MKTHPKSIRLLNLDLRSVQILLDADEEFEREFGVTLGPNWDVVRELGKHTRHALRKSSLNPGWWGYLAVDNLGGTAVGSCGFKGAPDIRGNVEIAYFTFPNCEGRGYATDMAKSLVEIAFKSPVVKKVVAHTLPEKGASTRVLEKAGFRLTGEDHDPDKGAVWVWTHAKGG